MKQTNIYKKYISTIWFACVMIFFSQPILAQDITLQLKNVTVKEAIEALHKTKNYSVVIKSAEINMSKKVSVNATNAPIKAVLGLIRQYGSKEEALKNMPAINLQLNDKSAYSEQGQIESISGVIDRSTGTVSLRAVFPNKEGLLHSGGAGNVIVPVQKTGALTIPQAATFEIQDKRYVYKVVDGKAQSSPVQVTRVNGGREFIVDEGLVPGDVIVAEGVGLLREGTPVKAKAAQTSMAGVTKANQSSSAETINQSSSAETINQSSSAEAINQSSLAETTAQSLSAETATASSATTTEN